MKRLLWDPNAHGGFWPYAAHSLYSPSSPRRPERAGPDSRRGDQRQWLSSSREGDVGVNRLIEHIFIAVDVRWIIDYKNVRVPVDELPPAPKVSACSLNACRVVGR